MSNTEIQELEPKILQVEGTMNNNTISKRTIIIFISAFLITVGGISYEITGFCSQMAQRLAENEKLMIDLSNKNVKLSLYIEDLKNILRQKDEYIKENRKELTELLNKIEKLTLHTQYLENSIKQKDEYMEQLERENRKQITDLLNKIEKITSHNEYLENTIKQKDEYIEQREVEYRKQITDLLNKIEKLTYDNKNFKDTIKQNDRDIEHLLRETESVKQWGFMDYAKAAGTMGVLSYFGLPAIGVKIGGEAAVAIGKSTLPMIGMA